MGSSPNYTRELVEQLVPTIWDRDFVWGMVDRYKADPDMPKAKAAKNRGNTLWAHLADIRWAWQWTPLTLRQAQAVILVGGLGYDYTEAGTVLGIRRHAVAEHYERGVGKLTNWLNATEDCMVLDEEDDPE